MFAAKQMPRQSLQTDFIGPKFRAVAIAVLSAFGALLFGLDIGQKHADGGNILKHAAFWNVLAVLILYVVWVFGMLSCAGYIAPILECASFKRDVAHLSDWHNPRVRIDDYTSGTTKIRPEWTVPNTFCRDLTCITNHILAD